MRTNKYNYMEKKYMLKIHPIKCADIPVLLQEVGIDRSLFFDRLQELKYRHGGPLAFECMQTAGAGYCFDQQGDIQKDVEGFKIRFDYRSSKTDKQQPLYHILF